MVGDMMSDILVKRLKENVGKKVKVFLKNDFRFAGKLIDCDEKYIEILDVVSNKFKIIEIVWIRDCEVEE